MQQILPVLLRLGREVEEQHPPQLVAVPRVCQGREDDRRGGSPVVSGPGLPTELPSAARGEDEEEERADERGPQAQERRGPRRGRDGGGGDEGQGGRDILPRGGQVP